MDDKENEKVEKPAQPLYAKPPLWILVPFYMLLGLLMVVVLVALFRRELDATGVALAMISLIGGVAGGFFLRQGGSK